MIEEIKKENIEETVDAVEVKEVEVEKFVDKVKNGLKKHGKKIAAIAIVGAVGVIGYAIGHKAKPDEVSEVVNNVVDAVDNVIPEVDEAIKQ